MKILQIEVNNYRIIKAMLLNLDGGNLAVAGEPGQGKTTAISVLWEALKMVGDPVAHGERKGQIKVTLGDDERKVFVKRSFTNKTAPITITTSEGDSISASEFASWFCDLGQNPHKIMDMKPKDQTAALLEAVRLPDGVDLDQMDILRNIAAEERLNLKRDGERDAKALGAEPEKVDQVNLDDLEKGESEAEAANKARNDAQAELDKRRLQSEQVQVDIARINDEAAELQKQLHGKELQIKESEKRAADCDNKCIAIEKAIANMPPAINVAAIRQKIQEANDANRAVDRWTEWTKRKDALDALRANYKAKNNEVKALDAAKREALQEAVWPLDGLAIADGDVYYHDVPLTQCGHSEQMLICGALAAETIKQHELRVVRMDGIESMGADDFSRLESIFNEKGIQVLSSRVTRGDIEDGELLIVDGSIEEKA